MPSEARLITFDEREVKEALYAYCRRRRLSLAGSSLVTAEYMEKPQSALLMRLIGQEAEAECTMEITGDEVKEALIAYCIDRHIPLPMQSKKRLLSTETGLALEISMSYRW